MVDAGRNSAGKRTYRKVSGATRQDVIDKLETIRIDMAKGVRSRAGYALRAAVDDWIEHGLPGRSAKTVSTP
jgi:hypothetical protein